MTTVNHPREDSIPMLLLDQSQLPKVVFQLRGPFDLDNGHWSSIIPKVIPDKVIVHQWGVVAEHIGAVFSKAEIRTNNPMIVMLTEFLLEVLNNNGLNVSF